MLWAARANHPSAFLPRAKYAALWLSVRVCTFLAGRSKLEPQLGQIRLRFRLRFPEFNQQCGHRVEFESARL